MSNAQENKPPQFEDLFYVLNELRQSEQFTYTDYNNTHILVSQIEAAYERLLDANKVLRDGLEFYACNDTWIKYGTAALEDSGDYARQILSEAYEIEGGE